MIKLVIIIFIMIGLGLVLFLTTTDYDKCYSEMERQGYAIMGCNLNMVQK